MKQQEAKQTSWTYLKIWPEFQGHVVNYQAQDPAVLSMIPFYPNQHGLT